MLIKIILLVVFFGVMIGIGLYCRKNATDVDGFVLGGRSVGPWLTAFAKYFPYELLLLMLFLISLICTAIFFYAIFKFTIIFFITYYISVVLLI